MRKVRVRDQRYRFSGIEAQLEQGEEIEICKHGQVIARLMPVRPVSELMYPHIEHIQEVRKRSEAAATTSLPIRLTLLLTKTSFLPY